MPPNKAKLLLIISVILVSLLSNKSSNPFFEFEGKGNINRDTALALKPPGTPQNNTDVQSTIYKTNNSSSQVSASVNKAYVLYSQGNFTQAIRSFDKALAIDPNYKLALNNKGSALYSQGNFTISYTLEFEESHRFHSCK